MNRKSLLISKNLIVFSHATSAYLLGFIAGGYDNYEYFCSRPTTHHSFACSKHSWTTRPPHLSTCALPYTARVHLYFTTSTTFVLSARNCCLAREWDDQRHEPIVIFFYFCYLSTTTWTTFTQPKRITTGINSGNLIRPRVRAVRIRESVVNHHIEPQLAVRVVMMPWPLRNSRDLKKAEFVL